jgi:hypothetical protein
MEAPMYPSGMSPRNAALALVLVAGCSGVPTAKRGGAGGGGAVAGGGTSGSAGTGAGGGPPSVDGGTDGRPDAAGDATDAATASGPAWQWTVSCPDGHDPSSPIDYGRCAIDQALAEVGATRAVAVVTVDGAAPGTVMASLASSVDARAESYAIAAVDGVTWVVGRDEVGAMYGALELAERVRLQGPAAIPPVSTLRGAPTVQIRAANLFWTLPDVGETQWWYFDESFWREYLDLLAHARLNVLDMHGTYNLQSTVFPNALLQLATSTSFPAVGAATSERERNLAMFKRVIALAHARGVRVGLMTYSATDGLNGYATGALTDDQLKTYTREATADLVNRAPGLDLLGFRTGESGKAATWYTDSFVAGVKSTGSPVTLYSRTWLSSKSEISTLAAAIGPGMVLEAKFNGEHLGPPYAIAGGAMHLWCSYSYQTYLNPPAPWQFVFQVRAGGTHRVFRHASYERTRRVITSLAFSPAVKGFTLEPPHAYTPQRDFYHASDADRLSPWTFVRDDLMYLLWGRLGYDPTTPEATFRAILAHEARSDALWPALQAASDIVPWIKTGHTCGPDARNFAPELEVGGSVVDWAQPFSSGNSLCNNVASCSNPTPFDTFAVASPAEVAADLVAGRPTSRLGPIDIAALVLADADAVQEAVQAAEASNARLLDGVVARDVARESAAVADLGRYFAHKLRAATAVAVFTLTGRKDWLAAARAETAAARDGWNSLVDDTQYIRPFSERLRMQPLGYDPFHWSAEMAEVDADGSALDALEASVKASAPSFQGALPDPRVWLGAERAPGPGLVELSMDPMLASVTTWTVRSRLGPSVPADADVRVLWKPFDSEQDWQSVEATREPDGSFSAEVASQGTGALFAVEVMTSEGAWRYPDPTVDTPYVPLAP